MDQDQPTGNERFSLIDAKFRQNKTHYFLQCLMATAAIAVILSALDVMFNTGILAAFGATSFIVFAMPRLKTSVPRRIVGGYVVGLIVGVLLHEAACAVDVLGVHHWVYSLFGAMAIGLSLLIMTMTNTEHPPAAGAALGLVFEGYTLTALCVIMLGVLGLVAAKWLLRRWLINLF